MQVKKRSHRSTPQPTTADAHVTWTYDRLFMQLLLQVPLQRLQLKIIFCEHFHLNVTTITAAEAAAVTAAPVATITAAAALDVL